MEILVTGATGFIGGALVARVSRAGDARVKALVRGPAPSAPGAGIEWVSGEGLHDARSLSAAVRGVQVVVHTAARAHVMRETERDALAAFRRVNVEGTLALAQEAARQRVKRFVFLSSIKVNGESTDAGRPFTPDDIPVPLDPYGVSKLEAETGLRRIAASGGMEVVIIRPPLVYGPGVKGNFNGLMRVLHKGVPLPLGAIHNRRSLVGLSNLTDFIMRCVAHPAAANETFLVSDGEDVSTTELLRRTARALGRPARLIALPAWSIRGGAALLGRRDVARRLCGSLQVDIRKALALLGWAPMVAMEHELEQTAREFVARQAAA